MGKKRIYELAKEINKSSKEIVETAQSLGFDVKNHMGSLSETEEKKIRNKEIILTFKIAKNKQAIKTSRTRHKTTGQVIKIVNSPILHVIIRQKSRQTIR